MEPYRYVIFSFSRNSQQREVAKYLLFHGSLKLSAGTDGGKIKDNDRGTEASINEVSQYFLMPFSTYVRIVNHN